MPVLPSYSFFRWVQTCMRVLLNQTKKGLSALCALSMKFSVACTSSSSMVSMRLRVSGPVSSMRPSA
ncbi:hypothetical protein D9M68_321910 [compost metagenome]